MVSLIVGRTRFYQFNPRYSFLKEFNELIQTALQYLPEKEIQKYYIKRTRPRRKGKPL
ncbi:MAG TPA: hypothetical protein VF347_00325 [Candidatus Humimicrobiaceae bacterium]